MHFALHKSGASCQDLSTVVCMASNFDPLAGFKTVLTCSPGRISKGELFKGEPKGEFWNKGEFTRENYLRENPRENFEMRENSWGRNVWGTVAWHLPERSRENIWGRIFYGRMCGRILIPWENSYGRTFNGRIKFSQENYSPGRISGRIN